MKWIDDDGGRAEAGFNGTTGDCVTRSIAIVTGKPYRDVYDALYERTLATRKVMAKLELRYGRNARAHVSPRVGCAREVYQPYLESLGFTWTPTMHVGRGCQVHLAEGELPSGRLIVRVSKHMTAVIDGVVHDTFDPSRGGGRCVYGYFSQAEWVAIRTRGGSTMKVNIPGRVVEFSMDGEAYLAFKRGEDPANSRQLDNDEYELFRAIEEGRRVRPRLGGYYVIADLTEGGVRAARYWAETLQTVAHGDASWDADMRMDLKAARRLLAKLNG